MNKLRMIVLLTVMVLVLMGAGQAHAQAQCPQGAPPSPEMLAKINATRGAALVEYCPQYASFSIPVTNLDHYFGHHNPPTAEMIREINQTRGAALIEYWNK